MTGVGDCALHWIARLALSGAPPARARTIVAAIASMLPKLSLAEARALADSLDGCGTCLSRALTVSARMDGARVAIGVRYAAGARLSAHAWVVSGGVPLRPADPDGEVIATLNIADDWGAHVDEIRGSRAT